MADAELLGYLYAAVNSELGIVLRANDPERLRQKLYVARKTDPDLAKISITISRTSPESELLLVKK